MEQVYYTQCPMGYGLGASNGFQVKRLTPGYPISGDLRHLGLRALLAGTRTLVPTTLRYRKSASGDAEVAWLTPRSHEYETERGHWGRPGGHFAHGLSASELELRQIANWPAGLFDQPCWKRADPTPTRGQLPDPWELSTTDLSAPPTFETLVELARGETVDRLAFLLSGLARAVREDRSLFLIGGAPDLARIIKLLTLAFPVTWRPQLTFSTFHDRPEDLPGFRIHGTTAAVRPNRAVLASLGSIVDLASDTAEPSAEWAKLLAGWILQGAPEDRSAWEGTHRRAELAIMPQHEGDRWSDDWLNNFYLYERFAREAGPITANSQWWSALASVVDWSRDAGIIDNLLAVRGPEWWRLCVSDDPERFRALIGHVANPTVWTAPNAAAGWGHTLGLWGAHLGSQERSRLLGTALAAAPASKRLSLVRGLLSHLPPALADQTVGWIQTQPACDASLRLAIGIPLAIKEMIDRNQRRRLSAILQSALRGSGIIVDVLDALAIETARRPATLGPIAECLTREMETAEPGSIALVLAWALKQESSALGWLKPYLQSRFRHDDVESWRQLHGLIPTKMSKEWTFIVLQIASHEGLPDSAFRWGVEEVLSSSTGSVSSDDTRWAKTYLDRTPSDLDLVKRMFGKDYRPLGIRRWLIEAAGRGELSPHQSQRLTLCERYMGVLQSGQPLAIKGVQLPSVPADQRGDLLRQMLVHFRKSPDPSLDTVLDACKSAWPGAFAPGSAGLPSLGRVFAETLVDARFELNLWRHRLTGLLDRLGVSTDPHRRFAPDSLAAEIIAASMRRKAPGFDPWRLREALLRDDAAWRSLAADVGNDLTARSPEEQRKVFENWDRNLTKGVHTARFFELWLNVADGPMLSAIVSSRVSDLQSLGELSWWDFRDHAGSRDDIREAFARRSPMAPLPPDSLPRIKDWLRTGTSPAPAKGRGANTDRRVPQEGGRGSISAKGMARWRCLDALSLLCDTRRDLLECWQEFAASRGFLPLATLDESDRYRFTAWIIWRLAEFDSFQMPVLAKWLVENQVTDSERVSHWWDDLEGVVVVPTEIRRARSEIVSDLCLELSTTN